MAGPPRPSFPSAPSEPSLRRLGVGGGAGGGDRPLRAQLVVALVAVMVLLAVPLYLSRRPQLSAAGKASTSTLPAAMSAPPIVPQRSTSQIDDRVRVGKPQKVKCAATAGSRGQEGALCDSLPFFEKALDKAIHETADCAPRAEKSGTINYVLTVDFNSKKLHVFPGASGTWKGPQSKRAAQCVKRVLPVPEWDTIQRQYRYYMLAIMATYEPPSPTATPLFE